MSIPFRRAALACLATALLATCQPKKYELEGAVPVADFTFTLDTSQFPVVVSFTNNSTDAFLYQWDFGDGSALGTGKNVTHAYTLPRTYEVKLLVAGRGGAGSSPVREVTIPSNCSNVLFAGLTGCGGNGRWEYSSLPGAIRQLAADGTTVLAASGVLPDCQADDQFEFTNAYTYSYDAGVGCQAGASRSTTSGFTFRETNGVSQFTFLTARAFIDPADSVRNRTYTVVAASPTALRLRGQRPDGTFTEVNLVHPLPPLQRAELLLTGGSARTWVLDNTVENPILVGTEAQPSTYYPNGVTIPPGRLPACQTDDEYTFTTARVVTYEAFAGTTTAGGGSCGPPLSGVSGYAFGPATGAGLAQLVLARTGAFIGTVDAAPAPNQVYRILSINRQQMVLRSGLPSGTVFTFKMRVR